MMILTPGQLAQADQELAGVDHALDDIVAQWNQIMPQRERAYRISGLMGAVREQLSISSIHALLAVAVERLARGGEHERGMPADPGSAGAC